MRNFWLLLCPLIVAIDYFTKQSALSQLTLHEPIHLTSFFNLTLVYNTGAAFGFLSSVDPSWERWLLSAISLGATLCFLKWYRTSEYDLQRCGIALIIGGAIGNLIDRAFVGHVIDFLDIHLGLHHWPAFNVADMSICVGVFLMMIAWVKYERHH